MIMFKETTGCFRTTILLITQRQSEVTMNKRILIGGFMALLLFAAVTLFAAAAQLFAASAAGQEQSGDTEDVEATQAGDTMYIEISRNLNGEELSGGVLVTFEDPEELPAADPDALGVFVASSGNELTLGTGSIAVTIDVEQLNDQEPVTTADASYDGDEINVLLTENTVFYEDTTEEPFIDREEIEAGQMTVTRTLEAGSAGDIGDNMVVRVWGSMVDGQLVADIVVYERLG
jgi:hypothetical protein